MTDFLLFLTCSFCVFSGLLIGYAVFYRDRSEDERARQNLKSENSDLRRTLQTSQAALDSLDEKHSRQRGQLNVLQQLCDDWSNSREINERERAQLESDLETRGKRVAGLESDYLEEKKKRVALEDEVHKLTKEKLTLTASVEDHWRGETAKIESSLTQKVTDIAQLAAENQRLTEKLHDMAGNVAKLESQLESQTTLVETASKNATGLEQEYVSLEAALRGANERLNDVQASLASEISTRETTQASLSESEKRYAVLEAECEALKEKLAQLSTVEQQIETLRSTLSETEKQLALVTEQRNQSMESEKAASIVASGLQKRLDNQESTIHLIRQNQDDALENLKHELHARTEIESKFDARVKALREDAAAVRGQYETQLTALRSELENERRKNTEECALHSTRLTEAKSGLASRISELELDTTRYSQSIVKLEAQREQLASELEAARGQMQSQLKQDSETIGELQIQRQDLKAELEQAHLRLAEIQTDLDTHNLEIDAVENAHARINDLEKLLSQRSEELTRLQAQSVELSRLRQQHHDSLSRQETLQGQLDDMIARQIKREAEKTDFEATIRELQAKLEVTEETISELRKERAFVLARIADQQQTRDPESHIISFTQAVAASREEEDEDYDAEYGGRTRRDANRGLVYTEAPSSRDDLKRISGIAEVLEKRLNDFGIYTFRQVMEWQPEEIEEFSRLLAFRDRIVRDDWQGQARFLYNQKRKMVRTAAA